MSKGDSETEERYESEEEEGFAIGSVVFPLEQHERDFVDKKAVLISDADTYIGSYLGKVILSTPQNCPNLI